MNITWQTATHEKITITKDYIRIKVGPDGDKHRGTLLALAQEAYKEYTDTGMHTTVRGELRTGPNGSSTISFYRQHGHNAKHVLWKTFLSGGN